jgi:hypothetical protein
MSNIQKSRNVFWRVELFEQALKFFTALR